MLLKPFYHPGSRSSPYPLQCFLFFSVGPKSLEPHALIAHIPTLSDAVSTPYANKNIFWKLHLRFPGNPLIVVDSSAQDDFWQPTVSPPKCIWVVSLKDSVKMFMQRLIGILRFQLIELITKLVSKVEIYRKQSSFKGPLNTQKFLSFNCFTRFLDESIYPLKIPGPLQRLPYALTTIFVYNVLTYDNFSSFVVTSALSTNAKLKENTY